jgi:hypothetical protein
VCVCVCELSSEMKVNVIVCSRIVYVNPVKYVICI